MLNGQSSLHTSSSFFSPAMLSNALLAALAAASFAVTANGQGMYSKNSPVLQVDAKSYNKLINKGNQVSVCSHSRIHSNASF